MALDILQRVLLLGERSSCLSLFLLVTFLERIERSKRGQTKDLFKNNKDDNEEDEEDEKKRNGQQQGEEDEFVMLLEGEVKRRKLCLLYNFIRSPVCSNVSIPIMSFLASKIPFIFPSILQMLQYFNSYHYFSP